MEDIFSILFILVAGMSCILFAVGVIGLKVLLKEMKRKNEDELLEEVEKKRLMFFLKLTQYGFICSIGSGAVKVIMLFIEKFS